MPTPGARESAADYDAIRVDEKDPPPLLPSDPMLSEDIDQSPITVSATHFVEQDRSHDRRS